MTPEQYHHLNSLAGTVMTLERNLKRLDTAENTLIEDYEIAPETAAAAVQLMRNDLTFHLKHAKQAFAAA